MRTLGIVMFSLAAAGCSLPSGGSETPQGVYYQLVAAQLTGDAEAQWEHLSPKNRDRFTRWVAVEKEGAALWSELGGAESATTFPVSLYLDGRSLFLELGRRDARTLGLLERISARVKEEVRDDPDHTGRVLLTTWGKEEVSLEKGANGAHYALLSEKQGALVDAAIASAAERVVTLKAERTRRTHLGW